MSPKLYALVLTCFPCFVIADEVISNNSGEVAALFAFSSRDTAKQEPAPEPSKKPPALIEFKLGYFFFASSEMRKVYDHGGLDVQLAGSYPVYDYLSIYSSLEYLQKSGRSTGGSAVSIWELPISLGLQYSLPIDAAKTTRYYVTLGPKYFFARAHNDSSYFPKHMNANGLGGFLNTGFLWNFYPHLTLDCFGEYSYVRLSFHSSKHGAQGHTVQAGGFTFGAGLAWQF